MGSDLGTIALFAAIVLAYDHRDAIRSSTERERQREVDKRGWRGRVLKASLCVCLLSLSLAA